MSAFGAAKLYFTLGVIAALIAFFAWEHVEDLVTHSPYWAQSPSAAQELGSHVAPARGPTAITIAGGEKVQVVVWLEHSHSYVRTGPFSAKTVINPALAIHALFPGNEVLRHHIRDGWDVTIDHESFDPVLTPGGTLIGPMTHTNERVHHLALVAGGKVISDFEFALPENGQ